MFGDLEELDSDYLGKFSTKEIAEMVFNDLSIVDEPNYTSRYGIVTREKAEAELNEHYRLSPNEGGWEGGRYHEVFSEEEIIEVFGAEYYKLPEHESFQRIWRQIQALKNERMSSKKRLSEDERRELLEREWELEEDARRVVNGYIKRTRNDIFEAPVILVTEYSDEDGAYSSFMENGNIFKKLPHIKINKH